MLVGVESAGLPSRQNNRDAHFWQRIGPIRRGGGVLLHADCISPRAFGAVGCLIRPVYNVFIIPNQFSIAAGNANADSNAMSAHIILLINIITSIRSLFVV